MDQNLQAISMHIISPDDWHIHLRDGPMLATTVAHAEQQFQRVVVMPNLTPPVITPEQAHAYRKRIMQHVTRETFVPLMALFLCHDTTEAMIQTVAQDPLLHGFKLYPQGVTTHSNSNITSLTSLYGLLEIMEKHNVPLMLHGESQNADVFDREHLFIEHELLPMLQRFSSLKVVLEHITTKEAIAVVRAHRQMGATITPHHLLLNRNDMLGDGIAPDLYCKPILKRSEHQQALWDVIQKGEAQFFLGSDSAPHTTEHKYCALGCAGIYHGPHTLSYYLHAFEQNDALAHFEAFASRNGPSFYGYPINTTHTELLKKPCTITDTYETPNGKITPLWSGKTLSWTYT